MTSADEGAPAGGGGPADTAGFVLPESTRRDLQAAASLATSQLAGAEAGLRVLADALAVTREQVLPGLANLAAALAPLQQAIGTVLQASASGRATSSGSASATVGLSASASGRSTVSGSASVSAQTHDTAGATDSVTVVVTRAGDIGAVAVGLGDGGQWGDDFYRLLGTISLQIDDLLAPRPASPTERYNAVVGTLALLAGLLALLAQMGAVTPLR